MRSTAAKYLMLVLMCLFISIGPVYSLPFFGKKKAKKQPSLNSRVSINTKFASSSKNLYKFKADIYIPKYKPSKGTDKKTATNLENKLVEIKYYYLEGQDEPLQDLLWVSGKEEVKPIKIKTSEYFDNEEGITDAYDHLAKGQRKMIKTFYFPKDALFDDTKKVKKQKHKLKVVWDSEDKALVDVKPLIYGKAEAGTYGGIYKKHKLKKSILDSIEANKKNQTIQNEEVDLINKQIAERKARNKHELSTKKEYWEENSPEVPYSETISIEEFELRKKSNAIDDKKVDKEYVLGKDFTLESEIKRKQTKFEMDMQDVQKQMQIQMMMMGVMGGNAGAPMGMMNNPFMTPQMMMMGMGMPMGGANAAGNNASNWPKAPLPMSMEEGYANPDLSMPNKVNADIGDAAKDLVTDLKKAF